MAILYYADFSGLDAEKLISAYTDKVDQERLSKLTRTLALEAKVRSLLAAYLLQVGVGKWLGKEKEVLPLKYIYGENGKPYLADYPQIYFSLSHSGNMVACAIADKEIGLDIQKQVQVKEKLAKRFFTEKEYAFLNTLKEVDGTIGKAYKDWFFRLWSIKESYIKFTGQGMKQGLDTFMIDFDERIIREPEKGRMACFYEIQSEDMRGYACSVCIQKKEEIQVQRVGISSWN